ncbi:protein SMALL AUXIN UP-REGULATED RNA 12-like [Wolffia australiana]
MKKFRGMNVVGKLLSIWSWVRRRQRRLAKQSGLMRLFAVSSPSLTERPNVETKAKISNISDLREGLLFSQKPIPMKIASSRRPAKGYLPVHVALHRWEKPHRAVVPVGFFNHPLFKELLQKAEKEFGFDQSGAITIPCPVSDFERICTVVASDVGHRRRSRSTC